MVFLTVFIFFLIFYLLNLLHTDPNPKLFLHFLFHRPLRSLPRLSRVSLTISPFCFSWLLLLQNPRSFLPISSHHLHSLTHFLISLTNTHIYPPLSFHMKLKLQ